MARLRRQHRRAGTTTVEAAFILPILLTLTFGMFEYGWLFLKSHQITNAARHGARTAAVVGATNTDAINAVTAAMDSGGMAGTGYTVSIQPADVTTMDVGQTLTVQVNVPYEALRLTGMPLPTPETLRASVSMAREGS